MKSLMPPLMLDRACDARHREDIRICMIYIRVSDSLYNSLKVKGATDLF
jgi:hypothetical protein